MKQKYIPIAEAAENWHISPRQVQNLCRTGAVAGAMRFGRSWMIPAEAQKPEDGRTKRAKAEKANRLPNLPMPRKSPFLSMTDLYTRPGSAAECIAALADQPEAQALFAAEMGFVDGYGDNTFQPDRYVTRAEAMKIINRTLNRAPHKDHLLPDMITWADNADTSAWYYAEVQEATNSHMYYRDNTHEVWEKIRPIRDWAELEKQWSNAYSGKQ